jgi:LmbE family N-acetylglucosaminyl deacetylase
MASKTYLVQTWDDAGALVNHYDVTLDTPRELADLKKFLRTKSPHVVITHKPPDKPARKR